MSDVLSTLRAFPFKENERHITVALSGGADSMALFRGLYMLREELSITLSAVHINHLLRGEESDRDEAFVRKQCKMLNVPLTVHRINVEDIAVSEKQSIELAARQARYNVFDKCECDALATAHNADDNLETVLFRLTRATGLNGLCGIPERRDKFIRPLLSCTREEVEAFCSEYKVPYVTDSTNLSDDFTRNRIRHAVVPVLKSLNPSLLKSFATTLTLLNDDSSFIDNIAKEEFGKRLCGEALNITGLEGLHRSVASRVISLYLETLNESGNFAVSGVTKLAFSGSGRLNVSGGRALKAADGFIKPVKNENLPVFVTELEECDASVIKENGKIHNLLLKNAIDCDKIVGKLEIRTRLPGDSITFLHRGVSKALRKWMNEEGIDPALRDILPVVADNNGVVWVYGGGVDKRVCPDSETKRIIKVNCTKKP
ncbi:MAG: tRNA lysidine(34) synthetase TilS [Clostridia bacterium]|nr:tRNA lysidine(34) synthetase TilS [Clostridia bacterium]